MPLKVTIRIHKRNARGRLKTIETVSEKHDSLTHSQMKELWETEQTINRLLPDLRCHIEIEEVK